jgi:thiol-disulfide isomerase/thioredoxin
MCAAAAVLLLASCGGDRPAAQPRQKPKAPLSSTDSAPQPAASKSVSFPAGSLQDELQKGGFDVPKSDFMSEDFTLETLAGKSVSLSSYKGKIVLLSFWATWCGPCQIEMPAMEKLYQQMKGKGLEVVAVDVREDKSTVSSFIKKQGYTFPVLLDVKGDVSGSEMYAAGGIPVNYLIDRKGKRLARVIGIGGPEWNSDVRIAIFDRLLNL